MKILIVTESVPFPPLNGRELPVACIFEELLLRHTIHLIVVNSNNRNNKDTTNIPAPILFLGYLKAKKWSGQKRIIKTLFSLQHSLSPFSYKEEDIRKLINSNTYDFVWISPVLYYGFAIFCKQNDLYFFKKIVIGLNDAKTWLYRDGANEIIHTRIFNKSYFIQGLLSLLLKKEEKRYFAVADLVHVQTQHEKNKLKRLLPASDTTKIIVAPNGIKKELLCCSYKGIDSNKILFMTHLGGARSGESKWFIKKVWCIIHRSIPEAMLLLVGKPPQKTVSFIKNDSNILVNGYTTNLPEIFDSVRLAVVPTFHGTGLINRISDALTAGIPVISTPQAVATFPDIIVNKQIIAAATPAAFAEAVIHLYNNRQYRKSIANEGRQYAEKLPTWEETALVIENCMHEALG